MKVSEITNEELRRLADSCWISYEHIAALAQKELDSRQAQEAAKPEASAYTGPINCDNCCSPKLSANKSVCHEEACDDFSHFVPTQPEPTAKPTPPATGKVEYWRHKGSGGCCKTVNGIITEAGVLCQCVGQEIVDIAWQPITADEYAKAKPCLDCGTAHDGSCTETNEATQTLADGPVIETLPLLPSLDAVAAKVRELVAAVNKVNQPQDAAKGE